MKKLILLLIIALTFAFAISAQETPDHLYSGHWEGDPNAQKHEEAVAVADEEDNDWEEEDAAPGKFRMKNRGFEFGLADTTVGLSNNFISLDEIFSKVIIIDLENLAKGLRFDVGLNLRPLYFFVDKKTWGFGLDIAKVDVYGAMDVSGNLINFKKTDEDKFGAGAAAFVDVGVPFYFHINKLNGFKVTARPAFYAPAAYLAPDMKYSYKDLSGNVGSTVEVDYNLQLYTIVPMGGEAAMSPAFSVGFDFSAGVEYPLFDWIDVGVNLKNMPFIPGSLSHYMKMQGSIDVDTSKFNLEDDDVFEKLFEVSTDDATYGENKKFFLRPFKMVFYANYRPFEAVPFTVIPQLGFMLNGLYAQPFSLEAGAYARYDLANMLIATLGINYEDRMWKNSFDLGINFRAVELDLGVSLQSPNFAKSWSGAGLGVNVGLKFGW